MRRRQPIETVYGSQEQAEKRWRRQPRVFVETGVHPGALFGEYLRKLPAFLGGSVIASGVLGTKVPGGASKQDPEPEVLSDLDAWRLENEAVLRVVGVWGMPDDAPSEMAARLPPVVKVKAQPLPGPEAGPEAGVQAGMGAVAASSAVGSVPGSSGKAGAAPVAARAPVRSGAGK